MSKDIFHEIRTIVQAVTALERVVEALNITSSVYEKQGWEFTNGASKAQDEEDLYVGANLYTRYRRAGSKDEWEEALRIQFRVQTTGLSIVVEIFEDREILKEMARCFHKAYRGMTVEDDTQLIKMIEVESPEHLDQILKKIEDGIDPFDPSLKQTEQVPPDTTIH